MSIKIGVGVITCDRPDYLKHLLKSLEDCKIDEVIVVNDGNPIECFNDCGGMYLPGNSTLYEQVPQRQGVGKGKNRLISLLLQRECDYIFLLEDDIVIKDKNVFQKYIKASELSGIQHFNFAFHGTDNYLPDGSAAVRLKLDYSPEVSVCLYPNVYGAFSMYTKKCIEISGLMDDYYYNAMEHVDHTAQIIKDGMHPPFRWFADIVDSNKYIEEIDRGHSGSKIRKDEKWLENFHKACNHFTQKHGFDVRNPYTAVASKEETINAIKNIKKLYGQK